MNKKLIIIASAVVVLLGGAGAGVWFFTPDILPEFIKPKDATHGKETAKREAAKNHEPEVVADLEVFVVNLTGPVPSRYLRTSLSVAVKDEHEKEKINEYSGPIRDAVIMYLTPTGGHIHGGGNRVTLVGPSGVGKSSAIIKLTLFETQRRSCRVAWVSTDQRRLTTGDPLAVYAGILGVRYELAGNRQELKHALDALCDCDLVLVDTAGGNPRDDKAIRDLAKLLHGFPDLRRALLMSAATNGADMVDWLAHYRKVGLHSLMFTKLDECRFFGPALGAALTSGLPLSYVTSGANFAGDLQNAKSDVFASLTLPGAVSDE